MGGFFLGVIVGGLIVYLFATKRGRKILKELSENGFDLIESFEEDNAVNEYISEDKGDNHAYSTDESGNGKSLKRRFFKGIKRKI